MSRRDFRQSAKYMDFFTFLFFIVRRIELTMHLIKRRDANAIRIVEGNRPLQTQRE